MQPHGDLFAFPIGEHADIGTDNLGVIEVHNRDWRVVGEHRFDNCGAGQAGGRINPNEGRRVRTTDVIGKTMLGMDAGQTRKHLHNARGPPLRIAQIGRMVPIHPNVNRCEEADDLLLGDLQRPANALGGRGLHACRPNQVRASGEESGSLGPAQPLAAGKADEISAEFDELMEMFRWRQGIRCIH